MTRSRPTADQVDDGLVQLIDVSSASRRAADGINDFFGLLRREAYTVRKWRMAGRAESAAIQIGRSSTASR